MTIKKMKQKLSTLFTFINDHWLDIAQTYQDRDYNLEGNLQPYPNVGKKGSFWSCYFAASFIYDLYSGDNSERLEQKLILITDPKIFGKDFRKGNVYFFSVLNHDFVIVYDENITYIDFYRESGRASRMIGRKIDSFRIETISRLTALNLVTAYLTGDFEYLKNFHKADQQWKDDYSNEWNEVKVKYPKYLKVKYFKLAITFEPNILDIWRVITKYPDSIIEILGESEEIEDQLKLKTYLYHLKNIEKDITRNIY